MDSKELELGPATAVIHCEWDLALQPYVPRVVSKWATLQERVKKGLGSLPEQKM